MEIQILIADNRIENLSHGALITLKDQVNQYVDNVVKEAILIEEGNRENGAKKEITSNIILNAVRKHKNYQIKKPSKTMITVKIASPLSILITGLLFDSTGYQNNTGKMIVFIIFLIVACISTVIQYVKE